MSPNRRLYFYLVSTISFLALLIGLIFSARHIIVAAMGGESFLALLRGPGGWLLLAVLALALWLGHWIPANRAARPLTMPGAVERAALPRKTYFYLGQCAALAAGVAQTLWAVRLALLWLLGGAATPASAVMWAAGAVPALLTWGYLRWENGRDADLGREAGGAVYLRRAYVYVFAVAGLALAFGGSGELLRAVVALLVRPLDAGVAWREPLAAATAALLVGLPLALVAWGRSYRAAQANPAVELNAPGRVLLRYTALLLGAATTLLSLGYLIEQLALLILRQPADALPRLPVLGALGWLDALAYLPAAIVTWAVFADGIQADVALGGERPLAATVRRLARYGIALAALAALWFGLTELVRLILQVVLGAPAANWWPRFARAFALVLVAAPAWWGHWWSQQVRARAAGPAGHAERVSVIRRIYLWAIVLVGAVLAVAALGFAAFLALNWPAASALGGVRAAVAGAAAAAAVACLWSAAHGLVLRGDARWLVADAAAAIPPMPAPAPAPVPPAPAEAVPSAPGPRRYRREDLGFLTTDGGLVAPARPVAVIDGADGAMGAALVAALRQARPELQLWPIGLNAAAQVALLNALGGGMAPAVPPDALNRVAAILGPADILAPGGLGGEVTAELAEALAASPAPVLLLPPRDPRLRWVAAPDWSLTRWVENAVVEAVNLLP